MSQTEVVSDTESSALSGRESLRRWITQLVSYALELKEAEGKDDLAGVLDRAKRVNNTSGCIVFWIEDATRDHPTQEERP